MPWSTKELADLGRTSLRTVRHYQELGLLPMPERRTNGYKQYRVEHLLRLLRIRRLASLGFPLKQIATMIDSPDQGPAALVEIDRELTGTIARLEKTRDEVRELLQLGIAPDLPPELAHLDDGMTPLGIVITHLLGPGVVTSLADGVHDHLGHLGAAFHRLAADADAGQREELADALTAALTRWIRHSPDAAAMPLRLPPRSSLDALDAAIDVLLNAAQADVLRRVASALDASP